MTMRVDPYTFVAKVVFLVTGVWWGICMQLLVYAGVAAYILALTALVLATPARLKSDRGLVTLAAVVYLGGALAAGALWECG